MKNKILLLLLLVFVSLLSSCALKDFFSSFFNSNQDTIDKDHETHPSWFSYPQDTEITGISLDVVISLVSYFPGTIIFGPDYFIVKSGSHTQVISGSIPSPDPGETENVLEYPAEIEAGYTKARYGRFEYEINESGTVSVYKTGDPDKKTKAIPREPAGEIKYDPARITSGPLVFKNEIIFASDEPSFLVYDRTTLELKKTYPMEYLSQGPLVYMEGMNKIAALHLNGTVGVYNCNTVPPAAVSKTKSDPVMEYIGPSPEVLDEISQQVGTILSRENFSFESVDIYGPRKKVPPLGAVLYLIPPENEQIQYRFYVDGTGEKRYLLIIFNEHGEMMQSNVGYTVSNWIDMNIPKETKLYAAAGLFSSPDDPVDEHAEYTLMLSPPGGVKK